MRVCVCVLVVSTYVRCVLKVHQYQVEQEHEHLLVEVDFHLKIYDGRFMKYSPVALMTQSFFIYNMITKDGKSCLPLECLAVEPTAEQQSICRYAATRRQMNAFNFARQMAIFNYDLFRFSMRTDAVGGGAARFNVNATLFRTNYCFQVVEAVLNSALLSREN